MFAHCIRAPPRRRNSRYQLSEPVSDAQQGTPHRPATRLAQDGSYRMKGD